MCHPSAKRPEALAVQVYRDLLEAVRTGRLGDGSRLPSSRAAAQALGLSRSTINLAYELLRAEGVIEVRQGAAPRVIAPVTGPPRKTAKAVRIPSQRGRQLGEVRRDSATAQALGRMAPGEPSEALFPADEWARALRRAARRQHGPVSSYATPHGLPELRRVLAGRLATDRGLAVDPEQILITTGTQGSLALAAQVLSDAGDRAALEDPGYPGARAAFLGAGLHLHAMPVDAEGARPDAVPKDTRLIYLTPSNQYPMGIRMSHARRVAFLNMAQQTGALILEDDYDSEFLWRGREIAALAAEASAGQVIYMGSASKVLMPALRLGWMVVPPDLVDPLRTAQRNLGLMANLHAQHALADMMHTGRYRAQLKRIARVYEGRGRALAQALSSLDGVSASQPDGGVQVTALFDGRLTEDAALAAVSAQGFQPAKLSDYCSDVANCGLVIGFADATPERIAAFVDALRAL
ncbi:HTH-type transcriptional regulatory protein GabR [Pseudosulfitobacter sp. DSM 107133]|nr:HTH-type transcriptional regulatory protein GabR [Pseudosulfitobacter sp. DSM 107133]